MTVTVNIVGHVTSEPIEAANTRAFLLFSMSAGSLDNEIVARVRSFDGVGLQLQPGDWVRCEGELDVVANGTLLVTAWRTRVLDDNERQRHFMPAAKRQPEQIAA